MHKVAKRAALAVPSLNTWIMPQFGPHTTAPARLLYSVNVRNAYIHKGDYQIVSEIKAGGAFYHGVPEASHLTWLVKINQVGSDYKGASCDVSFTDRTNASVWINSVKLKMQYDTKWRVSSDAHPVPV